jgi:uncharacterized protein (TIGR02300 family)
MAGEAVSKPRAFEVIAVVKAELGTKRTCPNCGTRFYDLLRQPIVCLKCQQSFVVEAVLPSKRDVTQVLTARLRTVHKPETEEAREATQFVSPEVVEVAAEDETAAIEDVDLDEEVRVESDGKDALEEKDDLLEEEEEDPGRVPDDVIGGTGGKDQEQS